MMITSVNGGEIRGKVYIPSGEIVGLSYPGGETVPDWSPIMGSAMLVQHNILHTMYDSVQTIV